MRSAIILHGTCDKEEYFDEQYPSLSNSHWFPWLQKQLLILGINTQTPEVPKAYNPQYSLWKQEIERFTTDSETTLVGHSCGGRFFTRWLSDNKVEVKRLVLVAPWIDPDRTKTTDFFEFEMDKDLPKRVSQLHILISDDDDKDIHQSVEKIMSVWPSAQLHQFYGKGHFTYGQMGSEKFPELLEIITK